MFRVPSRWLSRGPNQKKWSNFNWDFSRLILDTHWAALSSCIHLLLLDYTSNSNYTVYLFWNYWNQTSSKKLIPVHRPNNMRTINRNSLRCLLTILLVIQTAALKFGIPSRLFSQISTPKSVTPTEVQRNLEPITVDNSRNLMDITDLNFKENVLDQEGLTIVLFTR